MNRRILFVDDDRNILRAYKRQYGTYFNMHTALGAKEGFKAIKSEEPYAVILSDMRMPEIDGIQFLSRVKELSPDSVRMMLTGNADLETAARAVNEGHVFRFLTKPCPSEVLIKALNEGIDLFRLINSEKELLNKTLTGTIKILTSVLNIVNPAAFSKSSRMLKYVNHIVKNLQLDNVWQFDVAAMLSQFGCIDIPVNVLNELYTDRALNPKAEKKYDSHPNTAYALIAQIPRLENIALMIKYQDVSNISALKIETDEPGKAEEVKTGAQILKIARDFDMLITKGYSKNEVFEIMKLKKDMYDQNILELLLTFSTGK